jgi:cysteine desulfurase
MFNIFKAKKVVSKKRIYLDHASAVPVLDYVLDEYVRVSKEIFANPSSIHAEGEKSREILESLRAGVAKCIRARKSEVQFVSSSTEANNIFIKGCIQSLNEKSHIITSLVNHLTRP